MHDLYPMEEIHTTEEGTFTVVEPEPMPPVWVETPAVDPADTVDEKLQAILEKYGCTSAVGLGSLTALLTLAAAAYVIRKKSETKKTDHTSRSKIQ